MTDYKIFCLINQSDLQPKYGCKNMDFCYDLYQAYLFIYIGLIAG
jgi:hypothetical protein